MQRVLSDLTFAISPKLLQAGIREVGSDPQAGSELVWTNVLGPGCLLVSFWLTITYFWTCNGILAISYPKMFVTRE